MGVPRSDSFFLVASSTSASTEGEFRIFSDPVLSVAHGTASPYRSRTPRPPVSLCESLRTKQAFATRGRRQFTNRFNTKRGGAGRVQLRLSLWDREVFTVPPPRLMVRISHVKLRTWGFRPRRRSGQTPWPAIGPRGVELPVLSCWGVNHVGCGAILRPPAPSTLFGIAAWASGQPSCPTPSSSWLATLPAAGGLRSARPATPATAAGSKSPNPANQACFAKPGNPWPQWPVLH